MTRPKGLGCYAVAAVLARTGDAGAGVGVVLLAAGRPGGVAAGGLLAAALTAPHVLGSRIGRLVDRSGDARRPLAAGCAGYAIALAVAVGALRAGLPWAAAAALVVAGACGPLLTGGLSSLTAGLGVAATRARSVDVLTYAAAGTAGPAAVAALAVLTSPATALWWVAALVLAAAALLGLLPRPAPVARDDDGHSAGFLLMRVRPLRRVAVTTVPTAAVGGALGVLAVLLATSLTGRGADGAWLVAALGVGNLAGSLAVALRPPRGEPVRASLGLAAAIGIGYLLIAAAPAYPVALAAFGLVGVLTAGWVTATLAARERHAPPGRRAQVFTGLAGVKIAGVAGGTALAGITSALPARALLVAGAAAVLVSVAAMALDRPRARTERPAAA